MSSFIQRAKSSVHCDEYEAEKLVYSLQSQTLKSLEAFKDPSKTITGENREKSMISPETLKKLNLIEKEPDPTSSNIQSFIEIGWLDPLPIESQENLQIFVEKSKTSFIEAKEVRLLYLPSRAVMIKIMRACIGVKDPN